MKILSQREMFEKSFERPSNFFQLTSEEQWDIDKALGILDWDGENLFDHEIERYRNHYKNK